MTSFTPGIQAAPKRHSKNDNGANLGIEAGPPLGTGKLGKNLKSSSRLVRKAVVKTSQGQQNE